MLRTALLIHMNCLESREEDRGKVGSSSSSRGGPVVCNSKSFCPVHHNIAVVLLSLPAPRQPRVHKTFSVLVWWWWCGEAGGVICGGVWCVADEAQ